MSKALKGHQNAKVSGRCAGHRVCAGREACCLSQAWPPLPASLLSTHGWETVPLVSSALLSSISSAPAGHLSVLMDARSFAWLMSAPRLARLERKVAFWRTVEGECWQGEEREWEREARTCRETVEGEDVFTDQFETHLAIFIKYFSVWIDVCICTNTSVIEKNILLGEHHASCP